MNLVIDFAVSLLVPPQLLLLPFVLVVGLLHFEVEDSSRLGLEFSDEVDLLEQGQSHLVVVPFLDVGNFLEDQGKFGVVDLICKIELFDSGCNVELVVGIFDPVHGLVLFQIVLELPYHTFRFGTFRSKFLELFHQVLEMAFECCLFVPPCRHIRVEFLDIHFWAKSGRIFVLFLFLEELFYIFADVGSFLLAHACHFVDVLVDFSVEDGHKILELFVLLLKFVEQILPNRLRIAINFRYFDQPIIALNFQQSHLELPL